MLERVFWACRKLGKRISPLASLGRMLGLNQLARRIHNRKILRQGHVTNNLMGHRLTFSILDSQEIARAEDMSNEHVFIQQVLDSLQQDDIFYDVGANIGVFSLLVAKHGLQRGVRVHAFEPEPRNHGQLLKNIEINDLSGSIQTHQIALGEETSTLCLYVQEGTGAGQHSLIERQEDSEKITVEVETADAMSDRLAAKPTIMKIDIEGAEMMALKGMKQMLTAGSLRDLFMELHPSQLEQQGITIDDILEYLASFGYKPKGLSRREEHYHYHFVAPLN